jgi:hypothetical protein
MRLDAAAARASIAALGEQLGLTVHETAAAVLTHAARRGAAFALGD